MQAVHHDGDSLGGEREDSAHGDDPAHGGEPQVVEGHGEGRVQVLLVVGPHEGEHGGHAAVRRADDEQRQHDGQRDVAAGVLRLLACRAASIYVLYTRNANRPLR